MSVKTLGPEGGGFSSRGSRCWAPNEVDLVGVPHRLEKGTRVSKDKDVGP